MPKTQHITVDDRDLALTNAEKVYFPSTGFTKGEVIAYYSEIADVILPHLRQRPLTLKRYPEGVTGEHFYEKNAPVHTPGWVERFAVPRSQGGPDIQYVLCNDRATLLWATNLGDIEKHVLLAQAPRLNCPTSIVFDLDPGEPAGLLDCCRVALKLKEMLAGWGLETFVKVSGSKGLHLNVPLNSETSYELAQPFAKAVAELAAQQMPESVVSEMSKAVRRKKVLIDWSQNSDFKTTVCVYSMRAKREAAFVSLPVRWAEVAKALERSDETLLAFTPAAAVKRLTRTGDLFESVLSLRQSLPEVFTEAIAAGPPPKLSSWPRNRGKVRDKSLREYAEKRVYSSTPEPPALPAKEDQSEKRIHRFAIQKHEASHLHYDFRLEMQGVLRSWAVPKGPPMKLREARLAMHVEDHPMEYAGFEGTIPPGNYGAGTVMVWDQGEYEDLTGNAAAAFHAGKLHLILRGEKLKGEWILVKDRREEDSNKWLLIKAGKSQSLPAKLDDTSVKSGRSMKQIAVANDAQWQSDHLATPATAGKRPKGKKTVEAAFVEPMRCKPVTSLPTTGDWTFEIKFDGYRCVAVKSGTRVSLLSRNRMPFNARFPKIVAALANVPGDWTLDGELVALDGEGRPSFQLLQNGASEEQAVYFYAFDILNRDGENLTDLPLGTRRESLQGLLTAPTDPIRGSPILEGSPSQILEAVGHLGLEGVIGKRQGSKYEAGERTGSWIKYRTNREQEFVVGGYVPGSESFDSLLVGVYEANKLQFVAKVRNGFVPRTRDEIFPELTRLQIPNCPFVNLPESKSSRWGESLTAEKMKECRWVKPQLVVRVAFVEWTKAGRLRHCTFVALRDDKTSREVVRET